MSSAAKLTLFAVAYEQWDARRRMFMPGILYLQAEDIGSARSQFCWSRPNRRTCRLVSVGAVVGFFANEKRPDVLYAEADAKGLQS